MSKADADAFLEGMEDEPGEGWWTCPECGSKDFHNGDGCNECGLTSSDLDGYREGGFSWSECDCCGSTLGGNRFPMIGWLKGARDAGFTDDYRWEGEVCEDCLVYFANGEWPEKE